MSQKTNEKKETALEWFARNWKTNPIFSTACVLVLMIVLQTLALRLPVRQLRQMVHQLV